ncbi:MAG TPA: pilus assembly protein TadG-related protein [Gaiellaceae bacterium]|nr:pilus assembly protein TadG-related protein [Gaiellaceae bacterium]
MNARSDRGQATVLTLVLLVVLLGMAALVLDIGSWYRADRETQSAADAAALAGAEALPSDPANANTLAVQYVAKNGGGTSGVTVSNGLAANDTVKVTLARPATGVFTRLFGVDSVTVGSHATARASLMDQAKYVAPVGVNLLHPKLKGSPSCPCFGSANLTTLPLGKTGAPGAFDLINIDGSRGGTGPPTLADWVLHGLNGYMALGNYYSDPGAKWNSSQVGSALDQRIGTELLFPVYDTLVGNGANAQYHVVGWVGFHLTAHTEHGSSGSLTGWFTEVVWTGIAVTKATGEPNLGARVVNLID